MCVKAVGRGPGMAGGWMYRRRAGVLEYDNHDACCFFFFKPGRLAMFRLLWLLGCVYRCRLNALLFFVLMGKKSASSSL